MRGAAEHGETTATWFALELGLGLGEGAGVAAEHGETTATWLALELGVGAGVGAGVGVRVRVWIGVGVGLATLAEVTSAKKGRSSFQMRLTTRSGRAAYLVRVRVWGKFRVRGRGRVASR